MIDGIGRSLRKRALITTNSTKENEREGVFLDLEKWVSISGLQVTGQKFSILRLPHYTGLLPH